MLCALGGLISGGNVQVADQDTNRCLVCYPHCFCLANGSSQYSLVLLLLLLLVHAYRARHT